MNTKYKKLLSALLLVCLSTASYAEQKSPEESILEACDRALSDQVNLNKEQQDLNDQLKIALAIKEERINTLQKSQDAWYNNTTLMLFVGLTAGLITGGVLAK